MERVSRFWLMASEHSTSCLADRDTFPLSGLPRRMLSSFNEHEGSNVYTKATAGRTVGKSVSFQGHSEYGQAPCRN